MTIGDWGPLIVAGVAAGFGLLLTWHAVRRAHGPPGRRSDEEPQAGE